MGQLRLRLLGGFEIRDPAGDKIAIAGTKASLLLACLALRPDEAHGRDKLTALLWSDRGESQARGSLRQTIWALRKAFKDCQP